MMVVEYKVWKLEIRRQIITKTWCSDGYGSVGEHKKSSEWGSRHGGAGG